MGDIRIFDIEQIKRKFDINTFFETGTLYGDTIDHYKDMFDVLISIEIDEDLAAQAIERFKDKDNITICNGESISGLERMIPKTSGNILFWLDAHFPGADAHKVAYDNEDDIDTRLPLEKELDTIFRIRPDNKDVIIIDDLWLYEEGQYEWGSFDAHMRKTGSTITREQITKGKTSSALYNIIGDRYTIKKNFKHQGYLILFPKLDQ